MKRLMFALALAVAANAAIVPSASASSNDNDETRLFQPNGQYWWTQLVAWLMPDNSKT